MKQSTKKAIAVIVAATFPLWIVAALLALPVLLCVFIGADIYGDVLKWLYRQRPGGADQ